MAGKPNNAVAIYQYVNYEQPNVCRYGDILLVSFYDDELFVRTDGSVNINNGIPSRAWFEANKRKLSPSHQVSLGMVLSYYGL